MIYPMFKISGYFGEITWKFCYFWDSGTKMNICRFAYFFRRHSQEFRPCPHYFHVVCAKSTIFSSFLGNVAKIPVLFPLFCADSLSLWWNRIVLIFFGKVLLNERCVFMLCGSHMFFSIYFLIESKFILYLRLRFQS